MFGVMERILISDLRPHPRNAEHRAIGEREFEALKASIREGSLHHPERNGFRLDQSILVNRNGNRILAGHRRLEALRALGQEWVDGRDVTWCEYAPDSAEELAAVVRLNSPKIAGDFTEGALALLEEIETALPELYADLDFAALEIPTLQTVPEEERTQADQNTDQQMSGLEYRIIADCRNEQHQRELTERFEAEGLKCRLLIS